MNPKLDCGNPNCLKCNPDFPKETASEITFGAPRTPEEKIYCEICIGRELSFKPGGIIKVCNEHLNWQPPIRAKDIWDLI